MVLIVVQFVVMRRSSYGGIISTKSFADKLSEVKSIFRKALDESKKLASEMENKISEKNQTIENLQNEIKEIEVVQLDNSKFAQKLEEMLS